MKQDRFFDKVERITMYTNDKKTRLLNQLRDVYFGNKDFEKVKIIESLLESKIVYELNPLV